MTLLQEGWPPWDRFQARIKAAICRASHKHETVGALLGDLIYCDMFLRASGESLDDLDSPAARELRAALEAHAAGDSFRFDEVCAANVVLEAMNAIVTAAAETEP